MARTLRRPMFRIGGMAHEQRTGYMGGGMSGIMSGITPRQPDAGLTPRMGLAEGTNFLQKMYDVLNPSEETIINRMQDYQESQSEPIIKTNTYKEEQQKIQDELDKKKKPSVAGPFNYLQPKTPDTTIDGTGGGQSDLENIQDYMKMFEAAAAGDPDDARKSKYLELAKFGANLIAQPGGDLVGSIGKAASSSIGGLSKQMADEAATKKSAKLMGLKAGLSQTDMGEFGKKIKALAKFSGRSEEDVAKKFLSGDGDFDKIYLEGAEQAGVEAGQAQLNYLSSIKKMASKYPNIAAKLNKGFPKKNPVEGEYYVLPGGEFTRFVDGEKVKPSEPGFYDKED